jgi:two-component system response regulator HydG
MPPKSILIIDDDNDVLDALTILLEDEFGRIVTEGNPNRIPTLLNEQWSVILLDMNFSAGINTGNEGLYWLGEILRRRPETSVVLMTAYGKIDLAVEAIKRGAKDFILKPWDNDKLMATLKACLRKRVADEHVGTPSAPALSEFVIGSSPAMQELQTNIQRVAATDASVLILGENGTGKEVVAREIHRMSRRSGKIFQMVDMTTLTDTLFESELFGHKKGAFTDAKTDRKGRFESADGGTLFLDEIGNLPPHLQAKLLTALQRRSVVPVGSNAEINFDVRLITATNAPLPEMAEQGKFRQDLLYRINTITLYVPPLRERGDDTITLAEHFLSRYASKYDRPTPSLPAETRDALKSYRWPGNVRELQHTMEKAVILGSGDSLKISELNLSTSSKPLAMNQTRTLEEIERDALISALQANQGNILQAAKSLGITRQTLYNKMKKYGI